MYPSLNPSEDALCPPHQNHAALMQHLFDPNPPYEQPPTPTTTALSTCDTHVASNLDYDKSDHTIIFPGENEQEQLTCIMEVLGMPDMKIIAHSSQENLFSVRHVTQIS